ncbi:MAG TPA: ferritin-like domain-containing protein [Verrucomicrobiae bacterium]|nr:ferritin-like domain-containing protein [Verrucomicrobiae bacterium]
MSLSRARFIVASSLGAGAAVLLDRLIARAASADPGDLDTLNAAIELERAGIKAYDDAASTKLLSPKVLQVALLFKRDHQTHLAALIAAVESGGGIVTDKTAHLDYPKLATEGDVLLFAQGVEEKAASTYLSVIPEFKDRELAQVAGSIMGIETIHVGILAQALNAFPPYPGGFVK